MENMREYWAREAEMMRDKSGILGRTSLSTPNSSPEPLPVDKRNITVKGVSTKALDEWIENQPQKSIFKAMAKHPTLSFSFSSLDELGLHLRIREATVNRILELESAWKNGNNSIANYPRLAMEPFNLPLGYWNFLAIPGVNDAFITNQGVDLADAISSLMQPNKKIVLDCNRMSVAIAYVGLLDGVGKEEIKRMFKKSNFIILADWAYKKYGKTSLIAYEFYKEEKLYTSLKPVFNAHQFCLPGDIVYFRNTPIYKEIREKIEKYVENTTISEVTRTEIINDYRYELAWDGEVCICTGDNLFAGFGLSDGNKTQFSEIEIRQDLLSKAKDLYNLVKEKAKPIFATLRTEPLLEDVAILSSRCYRLNTSKILEK